MLKEYTKGNAARALDDLTRVRSVVLGPGFDDLEEARRIARHWSCPGKLEGHFLCQYPAASNVVGAL
jgi:hypothetical protein